VTGECDGRSELCAECPGGTQSRGYDRHYRLEPKQQSRQHCASAGQYSFQFFYPFLPTPLQLDQLENGDFSVKSPVLRHFYKKLPDVKTVFPLLLERNLSSPLSLCRSVRMPNFVHPLTRMSPQPPWDADRRGIRAIAPGKIRGAGNRYFLFEELVIGLQILVGDGPIHPHTIFAVNAKIRGMQPRVKPAQCTDPPSTPRPLLFDPSPNGSFPPSSMPSRQNRCSLRRRASTFCKAPLRVSPY
jgi:hypothetical protein